MMPGTWMMSEIPCTSLSQNVVGHLERAGKTGAPFHGLEQPLVGDGDDSIHTGPDVLQPAFGLNPPLFPFKQEWLGHDGHRQRTQFGCQVGDDGRRTRPGTSAQSGRNENHVGPFQNLDDPVRILQGRTSADVGIGPGSETIGELGSDLQLRRRPGRLESLRVGIGHDEFNGLDAGVDHSVYGVGPTTANADDLDDGTVGTRLVQQKLDGTIGTGRIHGSTPWQGRARGRFSRDDWGKGPVPLFAAGPQYQAVNSCSVQA